MTIRLPKSVSPKVLTREQVMEILKEADVNKDGSLNMKELKKALQKIGSDLALYRAWRCMRNADTDGDGKISLSTAEMNSLISYVMNWYEGKLSNM